MEPDEQKELEGMRDMFAGISLPGVIAKSGMFYIPADIAKEAYEIAEAMIVERAKRLENDSNS